MDNAIQHIPIISLSNRSTDDTLSAIGQACRSHGFFAVTGHGISQPLMAAAFAASKNFFEQDESFKQSLHINQSSCHRGFDPIGWQALDLSRLSASPPDLKESFYIGTLPQAKATRVVPNHGPNQWPSTAVLPAFRSAICAYSEQASLLAQRLMRLIAQSLGLTSTAFDSAMQYPTTTTRLLHYPRQAHEGALAIGSGAHTDWGALTILAQDDAGGLEVRLRDDRWIAVAPEPGALIINTGDLMQRWTNDVYRSSWHRVVNRHADRARYSIAYFFDLDHFAPVEPLSCCITADNPKKYVPIVAGEHIMAMYQRTTL